MGAQNWESSGPGWTEERVKQLRDLHAQGRSASEIAKVLGYVSRNGVIGKIHRSGMVTRGQQKAAKPKPVPFKLPTAPRFITGSGGAPAPTVVPPPKPEPAAVIVEFVDDPIPAAERGRHYCRWPIGDPLAAGYDECGRQVGLRENGRPQTWCDAHRQVGIAPKQPSAKTLNGLVGYVTSTDYAPVSKLGVGGRRSS